MPDGGAPALAALLAQHGGGGSGGELPMTIMLVTVLVLIWAALGVVCWIFWRAKKREDEARERGEAKWNVRSS
ncbi:MAG: hypothetical protein M3304_10165 [Actinomycetota bacterium]|nr:hypothetical protein [Actinomycetota bacterium]MDQ3867170.1 hypothetical protein [Actinomycetota bacterium]